MGELVTVGHHRCPCTACRRDDKGRDRRRKKDQGGKQGAEVERKKGWEKGVQLRRRTGAI